MLLILILSFSYSQIIPMECANSAAVEAKRCCPEYNGMVCGGLMRGICQDVSMKCNTSYNEDDLIGIGKTYEVKKFTDNRFNWPKKLFTHVCQCVGITMAV